jgi:plasmid stabilization system protein ParE
MPGWHDAWFHELAEREFDDALAYYSAQDADLGRAFLREVELSVRHVRRFPESGTLLNRVVRRRLVRGFPYSVIYSIRPSPSPQVRILAIANQKKRPFYWRDRR